MAENQLADGSPLHAPRASIGQRNQATRYRIADPVIPVLSYEFDDYIIDLISRQLQEALEVIYQARNIEIIAPELKLAISLWYYCITICLMHRTPGQEMFGVHLLQEEVEKKIFPGVYMKRYRTMTNLPISTLMSLSIVYALIPYTYERRLYVASWIRHLLIVIFSSDDDEMPATTTTTTTTVHRSPSINNHSRIMSIMSRLMEAIVRAWRSIAADHSSRIDAAIATAKEFYLMIFCLDGRYKLISYHH